MAYIQALLEAYIFYEIKRFDIKGKEYLHTLGKYYIVDIGLCSFLLGYRGGDSGHILENIIFFELMRRGYVIALECDLPQTQDGIKIVKALDYLLE